MHNGPTCTHVTKPDPGWDQYVCEGLAVQGEGSERSWLIGFNPPCQEMCVEFDEFRILIDGEDARGYGFYGLKVGKSSVQGAGWTYSFQVEDGNRGAPSRAPKVRCRFSWRIPRK